ncbi:hypothetical protein A6P39_013445 [Streptomyces sp. FXJ1.172]|uniref:hypothetical protein n=1 Tax=Streptomyces sp. FXJ1.172 TaxID=710705 RepID=UPI0007CFCF0A|nr:hypothetical protein [Streptomyces sp. FXJ1.172]WEO94936.1 hypothetical protein A6P39_013445 [Streptomyces sp. FXJ1.172]
MSDSGGSDLRRGLEALKIFQKRVNDALRKFDESPGASSRIAQHAIDRASFSGGAIKFAEADQLHGQYKRVHDRLQALSRSLGLHIEALGLAVQAADVGFDNVEEEVRQRFWAIHAQLDQDHQKAVAQEKTHQSHPAPKTNQSTKGRF